MKSFLPAIMAFAVTVFNVPNIEGQRIDTKQIGSNRYFFSDTTPYSPRLNWFLAYQYCRSIGMDLLSMPQREEAQHLFDFLQQNGKSQTSYWMSGNQLGSHMWIWMTSGQPLNGTFDFWAQGGPPLTKSPTGCMSVESGVWATSDCMEDKAFVCQLTRCFYFNYAVTNPQPSSTQGVKPSSPRTSSKPLQTKRRNLQLRPQQTTNHQRSTTQPQPQPNHQRSAPRQKLPTRQSHSQPLNRDRTRQPVNHNLQPSQPPHTPQPAFPTKEIFRQNEIIPDEPNPPPPLPLGLVPPSFGGQGDGASARADRDANSMQRFERKEEFSWALARSR